MFASRVVPPVTLLATSSRVAGTLSASATASCFSVLSSISDDTISPACSLAFCSALNPSASAIAWAEIGSAAVAGTAADSAMNAAAKPKVTMRI